MLTELLTRRVPIGWLQVAVPFALLAALPVMKRVDPDYWWHLETGNRILRDGIPRTDSYSWTLAGHEWTAHEWLSEVIIALLQKAGYGASVAFFDLVLIGALVCAYGFASRRGASSRVLTALSIVSAASLVPLVTARPQLLTWLLFIAFVAVLGSPGRPRWSLFALPLAMALWVNLHLGFLFGLLALACWVTATPFDAPHGRDEGLRVRLLVLTACVGACLLNPSGWDALTYVFRYFDDRGSLQYIPEWRSPLRLNPILFAPYYLAALLLAASLIRTWRKSAFLTLISVAAIAMSLAASRNIPFVAFLLIAVAAPAFTFAPVRRAPSVPLALALPCVAIGVAGLFALSVQAAGGVRSFDSPDPDGYPSEGLRFVETRYPDARLYNEYTWGGFIIHEAPGVPVFIDGRSDFYGEDLLSDYVAIGRLEDDWRELLDGYGIEVMLIRKGSRLADELRGDPAWSEEFGGPIESVFVLQKTLRD